MTTTDDARLVEIEAREQAATPGPWRLDTARIYALTATGAREVAVVTKADPIVRANAAHNGDFIAHSRKDVRYLLDRLKAAESRIRELDEMMRAVDRELTYIETSTEVDDGGTTYSVWKTASDTRAAIARFYLKADEVQEEGNGG